MTKPLFKDIAPAQAMGIRITRFENGRIELVAPFRPNINDKGTAFAGSISSMLTLAGWALITLHLKEADIAADVMVVKSEIEYTTAACSALFAEADIADSEITRILLELKKHGRSRARVDSVLHSDGKTCARMTSSYAIIKT